MKFIQARQQDKVYDILLGEWGTVIKVDKEKKEIEVQFTYGYRKYTLEGKLNLVDKFPTLFWNKVELPTEDINLKEFVRKKLIRKDYVKGEINQYLEWDSWNEMFVIKEADVETVGTIYFDDIDTDALDVLQKYKVNPAKLRYLFKQLKWY